VLLLIIVTFGYVYSFKSMYHALNQYSINVCKLS